MEHCLDFEIQTDLHFFTDKRSIVQKITNAKFI